MRSVSLRHTLAVALAISALATVAACTSETSNNLVKQTLSYYPTAQQNYDYAVRELKANNATTAEQYFRYIKQRFGYSKWATLAELGIADCLMAKEKFMEAIDAYNLFKKQHPGNEHSVDGYCSYKIAEAYHKQIPSDWFLAPPSFEKDQGPILDALLEVQRFEEEYKNSPYYGKAKELMRDTVRRLTDHELYVAKFYLDRGHPAATVARLEAMVRDYPGAMREPEILLLLGKTYLQMKKNPEARAAFVKLESTYPSDFRAKKAHLYIEHIDKGP